MDSTPEPLPLVAHSATCAAFFDLDKTILDTASSMALRQDLRVAGLLSRRALALGVLLHMPYLLLGADDDRMQKMANRLGALAKGWDHRLLEATVSEAVPASIAPVCYTRALDEIAMHQAAGHPVVVASASMEAIVRPVAELLGADHALGSVAEVDENGLYTGRIPHYNFAQNKALACAELAAEQGWDLSECWAYSDSITDLPLFELVGHPIAVNPDAALASVARERGWQIMTFDRTTGHVPASKRVALPLVAALGVGSLLVAAWWLGHRSARAQG